MYSNPIIIQRGLRTQNQFQEIILKSLRAIKVICKRLIKTHKPVGTLRLNFRLPIFLIFLSFVWIIRITHTAPRGGQSYAVYTWLFKAQPSSLWRHITLTFPTLVRSEHSATIRRRAAEIVKLQVALAFSLAVRIGAVCNISWCFHFDFLLNFDNLIILYFRESSTRISYV